MNISLIDQLSNVGIPHDMMVRLNCELLPDKKNLPEQLPYIDLTAGFVKFDSHIVRLPDLVIQINNQAVMYLVTLNSLGGESLLHDDIARLIRLLACRGDARFLGVVGVGKLDVYPIAITDDTNPVAVGELSIKPGNFELHEFLTGQNKSLSYSEKKNNEKKWVDSFLFELLTQTAKQLKEASHYLDDGQILSLTGRALFIRFISDRGIITDADAELICGQSGTLTELLKTPISVANTFSWLDDTFNGNLLPLGDALAFNYEEFFNSLKDDAQNVCNVLNNIMYKSAGGQLELFWQGILFQHVPADMMSQVYEHFAHAYHADSAKKTSIHYTPRHIAQQLVTSAFLSSDLKNKENAVVLDPASGAGVFLVLCFKRLVQENWINSGVRPTRNIIRKILNEQIYGYDINRESLKFSALSLYLTALELDPEPTPLNDLRFECLSKNNLLYVGHDADSFIRAATQSEKMLGSLSPALNLRNHKFDIVIGNPPWTKLGSSYKKELNKLVRNIAASKDISPEVIGKMNIDGGMPDIPFIWKATEFARTNGVIAYIVHAQHFLFTKNNGELVRKALLASIEITGILNASAIRNEKNIWPDVSAPFCFLIARNKKPAEDSAFYYLNLYREKPLNSQALFRIDPSSAIAVKQSLSFNKPWIFKVLSKGTMFDLDIVSKIANFNGSPRIKLKDYWLKLKLKSRDGVQNAGKKKAEASHLYGLPFLTKDTHSQHYDLFSDSADLPIFDRKELYSSYDRSLFNAPLVIFRESPGESRESRGAFLVTNDTVYTEAFFGYSCYGYEQSELLSKYLHILSHSKIFLYWLLMTSSKFGSERESVHKEDVDDFPVIEISCLNDSQLCSIRDISKNLMSSDVSWDCLDDFVYTLYGINKSERKVISDTLSINLPYSGNKDYAEDVPTKEVKLFIDEFLKIINPFYQKDGISVSVDEDIKRVNGWYFIRVLFNDIKKEKVNLNIALLSSSIANHFWASQIKIYTDENKSSMIIGLVAQNRHWTHTRARVLALDMLQNDLASRSLSVAV